MTGQDQSHQSENYHISNDTFTNQSSLEIRLKTNEYLDDIFNFLTAQVFTYKQNEDGTMKIVRERIDGVKPKMNTVGVYTMMSRLKLMFNPAVVQGNLTKQQFETQIFIIRTSLAENIMLNLDNWEIQEDDYPEIIDSIMVAIQGFMSRLIDNKERESFINTVKSIENSSAKINEAKL